MGEVIGVPGKSAASRETATGSARSAVKYPPRQHPTRWSGLGLAPAASSLPAVGRPNASRNAAAARRLSIMVMVLGVAAAACEPSGQVPGVSTPSLGATGAKAAFFASQRKPV